MYCKYGFSHGWRPCTRRMRMHESCRSLECISYAAKGGCVCNANATCQGTKQVCKKVGTTQKCESKPYSKGYCTDVTRRSQLSSLVTYVAPPPPPPPPPRPPAPPPRTGAKAPAKKKSGG